MLLSCYKTEPALMEVRVCVQVKFSDSFATNWRSSAVWPPGGARRGGCGHPQLPANSFCKAKVHRHLTCFRNKGFRGNRSTWDLVFLLCPALLSRALCSRGDRSSSPGPPSAHSSCGAGFSLGSMTQPLAALPPQEPLLTVSQVLHCALAVGIPSHQGKRPSV